MKDYVTFDDDEDDADFRYNMIAQFKQDLYNKNFCHQDQGKCDENNTLQKRIKFWLNVIDMGGPIPDNVYDYDYNDGVDYFVRGAGIFPEIRELKILSDILINK